MIRQMPFLWLEIDDAASPESLRGYIECSTIALLSNYHQPALDRPSKGWLGVHSPRERVKSSGLWNQNHVNERYDPNFLTQLEELIENQRPRGEPESEP